MECVIHETNCHEKQRTIHFHYLTVYIYLHDEKIRGLEFTGFTGAVLAIGTTRPIIDTSSIIVGTIGIINGLRGKVNLKDEIKNQLRYMRLGKLWDLNVSNRLFNASKEMVKPNKQNNFIGETYIAGFNFNLLANIKPTDEMKGTDMTYDEWFARREGTGKTDIMDISPEGLEVIANFELSEGAIKAWGLGEYDKNGNLTGIYPHYVFKEFDSGINTKWVSDGGITFGYGHYVDQGEYNKIVSEKALVDIYAKGAPILPSNTPSNGLPYKVPNSSAMPISEVMRIYKKDIAGSVDAVNDYLNANNIILEQHQFDMLVSFSHQYGNNWWTKEPEKGLPKFIREGQGSYNPDDVIETFNRHDYKERRAMEASIFNNGYK